MITLMSMPALLAVLDLKDYGIITAIVLVFAGGGAYASRQAGSLAGGRALQPQPVLREVDADAELFLLAGDLGPTPSQGLRPPRQANP